MPGVDRFWQVLQVVPAGGKILVGLRLARSPPELKLLRIIIRITIGVFFLLHLRSISWILWSCRLHFGFLNLGHSGFDRPYVFRLPSVLPHSIGLYFIGLVVFFLEFVLRVAFCREFFLTGGLFSGIFFCSGLCSGIFLTEWHYVAFFWEIFLTGGLFSGIFLRTGLFFGNFSYKVAFFREFSWLLLPPGPKGVPGVPLALGKGKMGSGIPSYPRHTGSRFTCVTKVYPPLTWGFSNIVAFVGRHDISCWFSSGWKPELVLVFLWFGNG